MPMRQYELTDRSHSRGFGDPLDVESDTLVVDSDLNH